MWEKSVLQLICLICLTQEKVVAFERLQWNFAIILEYFKSHFRWGNFYFEVVETFSAILHFWDCLDGDTSSKIQYKIGIWP